MDVQLLGRNYVSLHQIVDRVASALENRSPFSLVRIGDGENIVLAQEVVLSLDWIAAHVGWSHSASYCGVTLPNIPIRDRMAEALRIADIVGVFAGDDLTKKVLKKLEIQPRAICYAFENLYMPMYKPFAALIKHYPPLLVGKPAERFAAFLYERLGITVPGTVAINGAEELDRCIEQMAQIPHDWSLVSAGCNAVVIAAVMAARYGKVSIDFGHAPNNVMAPNFPDYWLAPV